MTEIGSKQMIWQSTGPVEASGVGLICSVCIRTEDPCPFMDHGLQMAERILDCWSYSWRWREHSVQLIRIPLVSPRTLDCHCGCALPISMLMQD